MQPEIVWCYERKSRQPHLKSCLPVEYLLWESSVVRLFSPLEDSSRSRGMCELESGPESNLGPRAQHVIPLLTRDSM